MAVVFRATFPDFIGKTKRQPKFRKSKQPKIRRLNRKRKK